MVKIENDDKKFFFTFFWLFSAVATYYVSPKKFIFFSIFYVAVKHHLKYAFYHRHG